MKNRRTLESIKREYKLFHNLSENIDNSYSQSPVTFYDEYEAVEAVMNQLSERSRCLAHIIKSHEENANEETLKAAYERLERSDAYFASLSADDQKKIENAFKDPAHEEFLKDKAWHHAYSAYLSTKSIAVSKAVQSAFEIRSKMEEQMNLMTAAAKERSEIRKN